MGVISTGKSPYGPIAPEKRIQRKILDLDLNQTASYVPGELLDLDPNDPEYEEKLQRPVKDLIVYPDETEDVEELCKTAKRLEDAIKDHFEEGIQLFYHTAIHCYKSNMVFSIGDTELQGGLKNKAKQVKGPGMLVEAHNAFFAGLLFVTKEESNDFELGKADTLEPHIFGKETHFYHRLSTTTTLPNFVNTVDSKVVFQTAPKFMMKKNLRDRCADILNFIAEGKLTPQEGLEKLLNNISQILKFLKENEETTEKYYKIIQKYYREVTNDWIEIVADQEELQKLGTASEKTSKAMRIRLINDRRCYKKFDKIKTRLITILKNHEIPREQPQHVEMLAKGVILYVASSSPFIKDLEKSLQNADTVKACQYIIKYRSNIKIIKYCKKYFEEYPTSKASLKNMKILEDKIKKIIKVNEGVKKINNITNIAIRCLQHTARSINPSVPVEWFFSVTYDKLDEFENKYPSFFGDLTTCLADENLHQIITPLLNNLKNLYEKRVKK